MAQLAIRGNKERGKEVIKILEMLGGKNVYNLTGTQERWYILSNGIIEHSLYLFEEKGFSLEEFLEKFPHKVGDKVLVHGMPKTIKGINWDSYSNGIVYKVETNVRGFSEEYHVFANAIQPYKEETMEEKLISKEGLPVTIATAPMEHRQIIFSADAPDETELILGDNYEIKVEDGKTFVVKKKPQYPKTYEECCKVLSLSEDGRLYTKGYKASLIQNFQKLLICRDAYWKIAGEQMGLGKPWEPDWTNNYQKKWTIGFYQGEINLTNGTNVHFVLAFPTEEMRDAFFENFKDLIEDCKELL